MGDESSVIRMHSGNGEHIEMDEAAIACFELALDDAQLSNDPKLRAALSDYFRWSTLTMSSCPHSAVDVAAGLSIAKWSWDGPA
jgi:hemoglobin